MKRNNQATAQPSRRNSKGHRAAWVVGALAGATMIASLQPWHVHHPRAVPREQTVEAAQVATFATTIPNTDAAPVQAPSGMVWIPGGEFSMGAMDPPAVSEVGMHAAVDARPIHRVHVDGFWMDKTDVTNEEFAKFVKATNYLTIAERAPTAAEFPGAPPENLVAGSVVFSAPDHPVPLDNQFQ